VIDMAGEGDQGGAAHGVRSWIAAQLAGGVLNVAGPRASKNPAVYERATFSSLPTLALGR